MEKFTEKTKCKFSSSKTGSRILDYYLRVISRNVLNFLEEIKFPILHFYPLRMFKYPHCAFNDYQQRWQKLRAQ